LFPAIACIVISTLALVFYKLKISNLNLPVPKEITSSTKEIQLQIQKALKEAKTHPTAQNIGNLGMIYHASTFYNEAGECYKMAAEKEKKKWIWHYYLGYLLQEKGDSKNASANFTEVTKRNKNCYLAWYYTGLACQHLELSGEAENAFQKASYITQEDYSIKNNQRNDFFPLSAYSRFQLARLYESTRDTAKAEKTLLEIIRQFNSFGPAYRMLSNLYNLKGQQGWAKYYAIRANELRSYTTPVDTLADKLTLLSKSESYLLKQIDEAEKSYNPEWNKTLLTNALEYFPDNKYLISKAVKYFIKSGISENLPSLIQKHLEVFKDDVNEIMIVGNMLNDKELYQEANCYYMVANLLKNDNPEIKFNLALTLLNMKKNDKALMFINEMVSDGGNSAEVISSALGFMLIAEKNDEAANLLKRLKSIDLRYPKLDKFTGMLAENLGNFEEAIHWYKKSLSANPADLSSLKYLCGLLEQKNQWNDIIFQLRKGLEANPNEPFILERLGTLLVTCPDKNLRNPALGKEFSERAFIHIQSPVSVILSAGKSLVQAYATLGDYKSARHYLNICLNLAASENAPEDYISVLQTIDNQLKSISQ
jgi:Flp pilus assembly protein TadD